MNSPILNGEMPPLSSTVTAVKVESTHGFNVQRSMLLLGLYPKTTLKPYSALLYNTYGTLTRILRA
jgi:hypothetical protein